MKCLMGDGSTDGASDPASGVVAPLDFASVAVASRPMVPVIGDGLVDHGRQMMEAHRRMPSRLMDQPKARGQGPLGFTKDRRARLGGQKWVAGGDPDNGEADEPVSYLRVMRQHKSYPRQGQHGRRLFKELGRLPGVTERRRHGPSLDAAPGSYTSKKRALALDMVRSGSYRALDKREVSGQG